MADLWQIMTEYGLPPELIRLIRPMLDGSRSSFRIADEVSTSYVMLDGLSRETGKGSRLPEDYEYASCT